METRAELLTPFGTLHGGCLSAMVDHCLGVVFYPVIPGGSAGRHHRIQAEPAATRVQRGVSPSPTSCHWASAVERRASTSATATKPSA